MPVFVALSRVLDLLVAPLTWSLLLLAAAAVLRRRGRLGWWLAIAAATVLVVFATQPVSNALYRWAEAGAVRTARPDVTYDAVVVLGGSVDPAARRHRLVSFGSRTK